jgi:hypothetical protein
MKVFLDDDYENRHPPEEDWANWVRVRTAEDAIKLLKTGLVEEISLDNDLGERFSEGHTVLDWLEERIFTENFEGPIPSIKIHSANSVRATQMRKIVDKIRSYCNSVD